jgi:hypothetical protein
MVYFTEEQIMPSNEENIRIWLKQARNLAILLVKRVELYHELCPKSGIDAEDRAALEKRLININDEIRQHCDAMRRAEEETKVGVKNILGEKTNVNPLFCAASMLVLSRISSAVENENRDIGLICQTCDPCEPGSLDIRDAFRSNGCLREHVRITVGDYNIDEWRVQLHEISLNAVLNRPSTQEETLLKVLPKELMQSRRI